MINEFKTRAVELLELGVPLFGVLLGVLLLQVVVIAAFTAYHLMHP